MFSIFDEEFVPNLFHRTSSHIISKDYTNTMSRLELALNVHFRTASRINFNLIYNFLRGFYCKDKLKILWILNTRHNFSVDRTRYILKKFNKNIDIKENEK